MADTATIDGVTKSTSALDSSLSASFVSALTRLADLLEKDIDGRKEVQKEVKKVAKEKKKTEDILEKFVGETALKEILSVTKKITDEEDMFQKAYKQLENTKKELLGTRSKQSQKKLEEVFTQQRKLIELAKKQGVKVKGGSTSVLGMLAGGIKGKISGAIRGAGSKILGLGGLTEKITGITGENIYDKLSENRRLRRAKKASLFSGDKGTGGGSTVPALLGAGAGNKPPVKKKLTSTITEQKVKQTDSAALGTLLLYRFFKRQKGGDEDEVSGGKGFNLNSIMNLLGGGGGGGLMAKVGPMIAKAGFIGAIVIGVLWAVIDGIAGIFKAKEWKTDKISAFFGGMLGGTGGGAKGALKNAGKWALVGAGIGGLAGGPIGALIGAAIGAVIGGVLGWIGGKNIAKFFSNAWKDFNKKLKVGWALTKVGWELFKVGLNQVGNWINDKIFKPVGDAFNFVKKGVMTVIKDPQGAIEAVATFVNDKVFTPMDNFLMGIPGVNKVWDATKNFFKDPTAGLEKVGDFLGTHFGPVGKMADSIIDGSLSKLKAIAADPIGAVKGFFESVKNNVAAFAEDPKGFIKSIFDKITDGIKKFFQPLSDFFGYAGSLFAGGDIWGGIKALTVEDGGIKTLGARSEQWGRVNRFNEWFAGVKPKDVAGWQNVTSIVNATGTSKPAFAKAPIEEQIARLDALNQLNAKSGVKMLDGTFQQFHQGGRSSVNQVAMLREDEMVMPSLASNNFAMEQLKINHALLSAIKDLNDKLKSNNSSGGGSVIQQTIINRYSPESMMNAMGVV